MSTPAVDLRYPVGKFEWTPPQSAEQLTKNRQHYIQEVADLPKKLRAAVAGLNDSQLDTPYRPDGWTVRQVVHHLADSHMNAFIRVKLTLTENEPKIKPYDEAAWAKLPDSSVPIDGSLSLIDALHARWTVLFRAMKENDWAKGYFHPEMQSTVSLDKAVAMYAWHARHHVAHITGLRKRNGW